MDQAKRVLNRIRQIVSYCILILIFLFYGLMSLYDYRTLFNLTQTLYNHPLVVSNAALQANVSITKMHRNMKDIVLFKSTIRIKQSIEAVGQLEDIVYKNLETIQDRILGAEGKKLEKEARLLFDNWQPIRNQVIDLVNRDQVDEAANITIQQGAAHVEKLEQKMLSLTKYARDKASAFMRGSKNEYSRVIVQSSLFLFLGITISTFIAFITLKQITLNERALRVSEENYRSLVESQIDLISRFSSDGTFTYVNEVFCQFFNKTKESLIGCKWQPIPVDDDVGDIEEKLMSLSFKNPTVVIENRVSSGKGSIHWIQFINSGIFDSQRNLVGIQSVGRDITDRKKADKKIKQYSENLEKMVADRTEELEKMQNKLLLQEKLAAIGKLSGSVAHDIRNPLNAIKGSIYFLNQISNDGTDDRIKRHIAIMDREILRANDIITDLLDFSKENLPIFTEGDINRLIRTTLESSIIPNNILVKTNLDSNLSTFLFDPSQFERIFHNLIMNAIQAMPSGGLINISTLKGGETITIKVVDTGVGITSDTLKQIFEPLFTTKSKGVGLGLSIVKTFVEKHNGTIDVVSTAGSETSICIKLPLLQKDIS